MKTNFQRTNHFLILTLGAVLIGFAPIFVKWSMLSSSAISFYRMLLAIPFLFLLNLRLNNKFKFIVKDSKTIFFAALASLAFTTDLTIWHYSMNITSVSNATIIVNSSPVFVAILSYVFFREKLSRSFLVSFLITYIGILGLIYFSNNYEFYLVGGAVRDGILGLSTSDFDFTTNASPDESVKLLNSHGYKTTEIGKAFGTIEDMATSSSIFRHNTAARAGKSF